MKLFIDTNIFLDIYHLSGPDLDELSKLKKMIEKKKIDLLISKQVVDEFWRNRERVIADAMKRFRASKASAQIPSIIRIYPEANELKEAVDTVNNIVKELTRKAETDIEANSLKADEVINELFSLVDVAPINSAIISKARLRAEIGNPPGKKDSLGDAINWEWLLELDFDIFCDELFIISADGDFESELTKGKLREYLIKEWNRRCDIRLEKSLTNFFKKNFPDIQLAEEVDKVEAIEHLEDSASFAATHKAISSLEEYDDFRDSELRRIINAYLGNSQIRWILGDEDVKAFALKVIKLAESDEVKDLADSLLDLIEQFDDDIEL